MLEVILSANYLESFHNKGVFVLVYDSRCPRSQIFVEEN